MRASNAFFLALALIVAPSAVLADGSHSLPRSPQGIDTPDPALNPKVIEAFRQYRFTPAKLNGRATFATFRETIILSKQGPL